MNQNQNHAQKIYPGVQAKEITFNNGVSILKMSFKLDQLLEKLKPDVNGKGYVNLVVNKRREIGKYGETHDVTVDTWKPDPNRTRQATSVESGDSARPSAKSGAGLPSQFPVDDSDVLF